MRAKERRLIVAFHTTHDAMAFEDFCVARGVPGRLIPRAVAWPGAPRPGI